MYLVFLDYILGDLVTLLIKNKSKILVKYNVSATIFSTRYFLKQIIFTKHMPTYIQVGK
jgi:hypothetical protein